VVALSLLATFPRIATWLPEVVYGQPSAVTRPVEGDDAGTRETEEREEDEFNKLFDDDEQSESDRQDDVDSLFEDEERSESDRQDEIDSLFEEKEDAAQKEVDDLFKDDD